MNSTHAIAIFSHWAGQWATSGGEDLEAVARSYREDLADHHTVLYEDDGVLVLYLHLGAFDHGAGSGTLVMFKNSPHDPNDVALVWNYEYDTKIVYQNGTYENVPEEGIH